MIKHILFIISNTIYMRIGLIIGILFSVLTMFIVNAILRKIIIPYNRRDIVLTISIAKKDFIIGKRDNPDLKFDFVFANKHNLVIFKESDYMYISNVLGMIKTIVAVSNNIFTEHHLTRITVLSSYIETIEDGDETYYFTTYDAALSLNKSIHHMMVSKDSGKLFIGEDLDKMLRCIRIIRRSLYGIR